MLAAGCSVCLYVHPMRILPHLRARVWVFLKERRWQDVATAVSWCDGYDEGQGALASTPRLWSCSVYTYKHSFFLTHTHTLFFNRLTCSRWLQQSEEVHQRNTHLITHPSDNSHIHTHTQTPHLSYVCTPPRHSHTPQTTNSTQNTKKENVDGSVQHNNRAGNLLVVLRQVLRLVSKDFCEC